MARMNTLRTYIKRLGIFQCIINSAQLSMFWGNIRLMLKDYLKNNT